jgi:hypothetical protein
LNFRYILYREATGFADGSIIKERKKSRITPNINFEQCAA